MKKILVLVGFLVASGMVHAQGDSITSRNLVEFEYRIKHVLIPEYERLLNFISDKTTSGNETDDAIRNKVKGSKEARIFFNDKVIIENDLKPGADSDKQLRGDMEVVQYLNNFNTSYSKMEDKSISLGVSSVSVIKKTGYLYLNVLFECTYYGTNSSGEKFRPFQRMAEVRLVNDNGWYLYINSIYFPKGTEMDSTNQYTSIIKMDTDVDKIMAAYDDAEKKRMRDENNKIQVYMEDGDDKYDAGDFQAALAAYKEARKLNLFNKEPILKINRAKEALAKQNQERQAREEKKKHVAEMKENAIRACKNYDFGLAKLLCDSIIKDYGESDPHIDSLNEEMIEINSAIMGIETAIEHKNLKDAVRICETKIKEGKTKNKIYLAEMNYRLALVYFTLDKSESRRIFEYSGQAIDLSGKRHQEALKIRSQMYLTTGEKADISHAVEDATYIINNDPRNPGHYVFRAMVYEKDQNTVKAIDDYASAIRNKTGDSSVYYKKARLEFTSGLYKDVIRTTSEGISQTSCYGTLLYYRILAKEKTGDYKGAGADFQKATSCTLADSALKSIQRLSTGYTIKGQVLFAQQKYSEALDEYSKAVWLDSSDLALYMKGKCEISLNKNFGAIEDLSALIRRNEAYRDARCQRGIAYTNLGRYQEADADFEEELHRYFDNAHAHYARGLSLYKQRDYEPAAVSFIQAGTMSYSDSAFYMAALSNYNNGNYSKAIDNSMNARKKDSKKFEVYYIAGRAYYNLARYEEAIKEFEKARKLVPYDDNLYFFHAASLEGNGDFRSASEAYEQLAGSPLFKDTAGYRSAICLLRTRKTENYPLAAGKLVRYVSSDRNPDKSESNAWAAYAMLCTGSAENAEKYLDAAKKSNEQQAMVQFVMACQHVKNNRYEEALGCLEKAVPLLNFKRDYYDSEPLLKELRKNQTFKERYVKLVEKREK